MHGASERVFLSRGLCMGCMHLRSPPHAPESHAVCSMAPCCTSCTPCRPAPGCCIHAIHCSGIVAMAVSPCCAAHHCLQPPGEPGSAHNTLHPRRVCAMLCCQCMRHARQHGRSRKRFAVEVTGASIHITTPAIPCCPQVEEFEYEMEELQGSLKKKSKPPPRLTELEGIVTQHKVGSTPS